MKVENINISLSGKDIDSLIQIFKGYLLSCSGAELEEILTKYPIKYCEEERFIYDFFSQTCDPDMFRHLVKSMLKRKNEHINWLAGEVDEMEDRLPVPKSKQDTKDLLFVYGDRWLGIDEK